MNGWFGANRMAEPSTLTTFRKTSDFTRVSPGSIWVMIEEHPWTIDDGAFELAGNRTPAGAVWADYPASRHGHRAPVSFADGHVEMRKWTDPRTLPSKDPPLPTVVRVEGSADYLYLAGQTTVLTEYGASLQ